MGYNIDDQFRNMGGAIELAKLTPASGWGVLPDPATVTLSFSRHELMGRISRTYRQLHEGSPRQAGETPQEWMDRLCENDDGTFAGTAKRKFHAMRVAYLNLEALS